MSKAIVGLTAVLAILVAALLAPTDNVKAQTGSQTPAADQPAENQPAANEPATNQEGTEQPASGEKKLTDEEIRKILSKNTLARWNQWKDNRGVGNNKACGDYNNGQGPSKPVQVYCSPEDVPPAQIQQYRDQLRKENSTFVNEPQVKF